MAGRPPVQLSDIDSETLGSMLHELKVHQIELELQNEELRNIQVHLELAKNKYADLFNSAPVSFIVLDSSGYILEANQVFFHVVDAKTSSILHRPFHEFMTDPSKKAFLGQYKAFFKNPEKKTIDVELFAKKGGILSVRLYGSKENFSGRSSLDENLRVAAIDITEQVKAEKNQAITIHKLVEANLRIKEQQVSIIEQERAKVLLQMAGATAHELNQPLTVLLGSLELIEICKDDLSKREKYLQNIRKAGERIARITKKIQSIHHDKTMPYPGGNEIIKLDQDVIVLCVENDDSAFDFFQGMLRRQGLKNIVQAQTIETAKRRLKETLCHLVFISGMLPDGGGLRLLEYMRQNEIQVPVVVITEPGCEQIAAMKNGACDSISRSDINQVSLFKCVTKALEDFRRKRETRLAAKN